MFNKYLIFAIVLIGCFAAASKAERVPYPFSVGGSAYWWYYARFEVYPVGTDCRGKPEGAILFVHTEDGSDSDIGMLICGSDNGVHSSGSVSQQIGVPQTSGSECLITPTLVDLLPIDFTDKESPKAVADRENLISKFEREGSELCRKWYGVNARLANAGDLPSCFDSNAPQVDASIKILGGTAGVYGIHSGRVWAQTPLDTDGRQWAYSTACADGNRCTGYVQADSCTVSQIFDPNGLLQAGTGEYVPGTDPSLPEAWRNRAPLMCVRSTNFASHPLPRNTANPNQNNVDCARWNNGAFSANQAKALTQNARGAGYGTGPSDFYLGVNDGDGVAQLFFDGAAPVLAPLASDTSECYDFLSCETRVPISPIVS